MKSKSYLSLFTSLLIITLAIVSCKKGDTGPAGPAGATGAAGPAGPQGPKGDTGTANVIYSPWLDVAYAPDTVHIGTIIDTIGFFATITAAKLTNAILTSGEIKVYVNVNTPASPVVIPLPYLDIYSGISITAAFLLQRIELYSNANVGTFTQAGVKYQQYRYILIPGGVTGRLAKPINWKDYNEVKAYLGLKD